MAATFASSSWKIVNLISSLRACSLHGLNLTEEELAVVSISSRSSLQSFVFLFLSLSVFKRSEEHWHLLGCASRADRLCVPVTGGSHGHREGWGHTLSTATEHCFL